MGTIGIAASVAAVAFFHEGLPPLTVKAYGCCACQRRHYEGDLLYQTHLHRQSKHGVETLPLWVKIADQHRP